MNNTDILNLQLDKHTTLLCIDRLKQLILSSPNKREVCKSNHLKQIDIVETNLIVSNRIMYNLYNTNGLITKESILTKDYKLTFTYLRHIDNTLSLLTYNIVSVAKMKQIDSYYSRNEIDNSFTLNDIIYSYIETIQEGA